MCEGDYGVLGVSSCWVEEDGEEEEEREEERVIYRETGGSWNNLSVQKERGRHRGMQEREG